MFGVLAFIFDSGVRSFFGFCLSASCFLHLASRNCHLPFAICHLPFAIGMQCWELNTYHLAFPDSLAIHHSAFPAVGVSAGIGSGICCFLFFFVVVVGVFFFFFCQTLFAWQLFHLPHDMALDFVLTPTSEIFSETNLRVRYQRAGRA